MFAHRLAAAISPVCHPALVGTLGLVLAMRQAALPPRAAASVFAGLILPGVLIPVVCQLVLWRLGVVTDLYVTHPAERRRFLVVSAIVVLPCLLLALWVLPLTPDLRRITSMLIGGTLAFTALSVRVKASLHVAVLTAVVVGLLLIYGDAYASGLALIPVVGWARRVLKHYTLGELSIGALVSTLIIVVLAKVERGLRGSRGGHQAGHGARGPTCGRRSGQRGSGPSRSNHDAGLVGTRELSPAPIRGSSRPCSSSAASPARPPPGHGGRRETRWRWD